MENQLYEGMNNMNLAYEGGDMLTDDDDNINVETPVIESSQDKPEEIIQEKESLFEDPPYPIYDEKDNTRILCQVCGKSFKAITQSHLKAHNITPEDYKRKYGTPLITETQKKHMSAINKQKFKDLFKRHEDKPPETEEVLEEVLIDDIISSEEVLEEISFDQEFKDIAPVGQVIQDPMYAKTEIAYNLEELFNGMVCKENHFIEEYSGSFSFIGSRHLKYSFITDVAIPERKIAFFFPDTFWHNREVATDPNKYTKIKEDGWTVIEVKGNAPTMAQIKEKLRASNLI